MPHKRCLEFRIAIVAVLCMLVPTFGVGWLGYSQLYNVIESNSIRSVGHIASNRRNELVTILQRVSDRSAHVLGNIVANCKGNYQPIRSCGLSALTVFVNSERALGASLRIFLSGEDIIVGAPDTGNGDWKPFNPGQLARFSNHDAGGERTYNIEIEDEAHTMRLIVTFPVSLIQPLFINDADLGRSGETFLSDAQGFFITNARYPSVQGLSHPISARPMQACLAADNREVLDQDYRNIAVIHGFRYIPEIGGGCIMAHIDQSEAFAPLNALKIKMQIVVVIIIGLAFFVSVAIARSISRPIVRLTEVTREIINGNYDVTTQELGSCELLELSKSFNHMTDRLKLTVQELREQKEAMNRYVSELEIANEQAKVASIAKGRFLATMSHELRTPLNAIIGFTDVILSQIESVSAHQHAGIVLQSARNLLDIIDEILDFSKLDAGHVSLKCQDFDLREFLLAVADSFSGDVKRKNLTLTVVLPPEAISQLNGDPGVLRQVLNNLVGNAIKFTNTGSVEIAVSSLNNSVDDNVTVSFSVTDTGIGIRPENQFYIFDIFAREDESLTAQYSGTGLGLAISKRLVTLLGGEIHLQSTPGVGSCFSFTARFARAKGEIASVEPACLTEEPYSGSGKSVLVVEDDQPSQTLICHILENAGYAVRAVKNGSEALVVLSECKIDLVLMNLRMPVLDGVSAAWKIQLGAVPDCPPNIPIIAVTAHALAGDRERFIRYGMTDCVTKPIDSRVLLSTIQKVLDGKWTGRWSAL